jgi:PH domain
MEGFLTKKGGVSWKKRWFTLDDHVITYYSKQGDAKPRGRMVLNAESRVTNLPTRANAFQVITNNKALMVYADTGEEKEQWFTTLNSQIEALKDRAAVRRARRNTRYNCMKLSERYRTVSKASLRLVGHAACSKKRAALWLLQFWVTALYIVAVPDVVLDTHASSFMLSMHSAAAKCTALLFQLMHYSFCNLLVASASRAKAASIDRSSKHKIIFVRGFDY